jgi:hypothetical protein
MTAFGNCIGALIESYRFLTRTVIMNKVLLTELSGLMFNAYSQQSTSQHLE